MSGVALGFGDRVGDRQQFGLAAKQFEDFPIEPHDPALTSFPVTVRNGAVLADFTAPGRPGAS